MAPVQYLSWKSQWKLYEKISVKTSLKSKHSWKSFLIVGCAWFSECFPSTLFGLKYYVEILSERLKLSWIDFCWKRTRKGKNGFHIMIELKATYYHSITSPFQWFDSYCGYEIWIQINLISTFVTCALHIISSILIKHQSTSCNRRLLDFFFFFFHSYWVIQNECEVVNSFCYILYLFFSFIFLFAL